LEELEKILEAAELLFRKYGIRSVTMSDIASQLGMSKKTLYQYIENKNELVEKILKKYIENEKLMCNQAADTSDDALQEMFSISIQVQRNIENMNPSLLFDLRKYHFEVWQLFEQHRKDFILSIMKNNLKRGIEEAIYRKDMDIEIISRIHIGTINIFSDDELLPPDQFPRPTVHKQFVLYHLYGIVSEKGRQLMSDYLKLLGITT
jgi:TetR/AcrR family transcriptional regulator, cholesterol catabolism regulator